VKKKLYIFHICISFSNNGNSIEYSRPVFEKKAFREKVLSKRKLGRIGQPEALCGAINFLASDVSSLMTGSALKLAGDRAAE
jgi:NAD(P)-dependent dehydrogenase (short-subunit alcohol dehydrogenase family)